MRPNDGKHIAEGKGVHREVVIDLSLRLSKTLKDAGGTSMLLSGEVSQTSRMASSNNELREVIRSHSTRKNRHVRGRAERNRHIT